MMRSGMANLPLHGGRCPRWLFPRMKKLAGSIAETIVNEYGRTEFLRRVADPFFLQSVGCAIGYDWHSSGLTTTTLAALKESVNQLNLGIQICGGKGSASRKTPAEIGSTGFRISSQRLQRLAHSSRMAAKVDSNLIQDGYQLYHHSFVFTESGKWAVVQQGMHGSNGYARRYHWLSDNVASFVEEPHSGICGEREGIVLDMTARESCGARKAAVDLVNDNPQHLLKHFRPKQSLLSEFPGNSSPVKTLTMHRHEPILMCDLSRRSVEMLKKAYEVQPENYEELIALKGIGAKTIRALALVSQLVYGSSASWEDPAKFSFALGGKDGYPYSISRKHYDKTVAMLRNAVAEAKIGEKDKLEAIRKLRNFA